MARNCFLLCAKHFTLDPRIRDWGLGKQGFGVLFCRFAAFPHWILRMRIHERPLSREVACVIRFVMSWKKLIRKQWDFIARKMLAREISIHIKSINKVGISINYAWWRCGTNLIYLRWRKIARFQKPSKTSGSRFIETGYNKHFLLTAKG